MKSGNEQKLWPKIIEAIDKPLGFFVLALLIVETFLTLVLTLAGFDSDKKFFGMEIGTGLFIFVVLIVTVFAWFKPMNLTYDKEAHLKQNRTAPLGSNKKIIKNTKELESGTVPEKEAE